jgi:acetylornithine deacetylase
MELLARQADALGLEARVVEHDLAALRAHPEHPGEEAPRDELVGVVVRGRGVAPDGGRLALCGHLDVVGAGTEPWTHGSAWSGAVEDGCVWGRGSVDMKAGVVAALHALAAADAGGVLLAVASEEDGGLGAFAALQDDAAFDGCVIPEPTGFRAVCAQAGALTFTGTVPGVAAHAAHRLEGVSAIDRYVAIHQALAGHEIALNAEVEHPLMRELELPYPVLVGRVEGGTWSSSVPDHLTFEGRAPVRVGEGPAAARAALEATVTAACPEAAVTWTGGQFASAATAPGHPLVARVRAAARTHLGHEIPLAGVPWGADMRHFTALGIPTVMFGTSGIECAHAVDERVPCDEVVTLARILATHLKVPGTFRLL